MESATEIHYAKSSEYQDQSYLRKDHNVFMNDWYSGNIIFKELYVNSRDACGNMRQNRLGIPYFSNKLQKGVSGYWNTNILLVIKWFDNFEPEMMKTGRSIGKPMNELKTSLSDRIQYKYAFC